MDEHAHTQNDMKWADLPNRDDTERARIGAASYQAARWIDGQQGIRNSEVLLQGRQYGSLRPESYASRGAGVGQTSLDYVRELQQGPPKISMNVTRAVIDTAVSRVTSLDVRPMYLTEGGDWKTQQLAKKLGLFSDGQLAAAKARTLGPEVFRDSCWADIGVVHIGNKEGEIYSERVFPLELKVDHSEGRYGKPRHIYRTKWIPKDVLIDLFPQYEREINAAHTGVWDDVSDSQRQMLADQVFVVEAWALPQGKLPGRHVISVQTMALLVEPWTRKSFPFAFCRYSRRLRGFLGVGMAEHIKGNQSELNHIAKTLQKIYQFTVPSVWLEAGNNVQRGQLTDEIMAARTYVGKEPYVHDGAAPHPSLLQRAKDLWDLCFTQEGLNSLDATAMRPAGVNTGPAQRVYREGGTERFSVASKNYEQFILDWSECLLEEAREMSKKNKKVSVLVPGKRYSERLDFSKVNLERDKYVLQCFPTASLPREPTGRLAQLGDMMQLGLVDALTGKRLMSFPDVDAELDLELAPYDDILAEVSRIQDGETYRPPEPFQALDWGIKVFQWSYLRARRDGAPADVLDNLQLWAVQADDLLKLQAAPGGAPPGGAPGAPPPDNGLGSPMAKPAAPPVNPMLPNAPGLAG